MKQHIVKMIPESIRSPLRLLTRKGRLIKKVKARKRARAASPHTYAESPTVSLVIQSFNHRGNIERIVDRLRLTVADELIVCEDGSVDGSDRAWRRQLTRPNDFLLQSNDLHEIRTYNRAISFARGEFIGLLQDDDIPPQDPRWLNDAIALFRRYPKMAVLGGWNGWTFDFSDVERSFGTPVGPTEQFREGQLSLVDPELKVPFQFVEAVGIGPLFFRRADFEALGGFDLRFSRPGEPGIWLDYDICLRAWFSGRQVGAYQSMPFERNIGGQGTVMFSGSARSDNFRRNLQRVQEEFASKLDTIRGPISDLNSALVDRLEPSRTSVRAT